jgi:hypothetical protein
MRAEEPAAGMIAFDLEALQMTSVMGTPDPLMVLTT